MLLTVNEEMGLWTLIAVSEDEATLVSNATALLQVKDKIIYRGSSSNRETRELKHIRFHVGGKPEQKITRNPSGGSTHETIYVGGVEVIVEPSTPYSRMVMGGMRDTCFFADGCIYFIEASSIQGLPTIVCTGSFCKHCNSPILKPGRCEWHTCDACVEKCEHEWKEGSVHGGDAGDLGLGQYCGKCGIGKPNGISKLPISVQHLMLQKQYGMTVMYSDLGLTPEQVVSAELQLIHALRSA